MPTPVVGLIGCGTIGRFHSRNVRAVFRSGLVEGSYEAVCDRELGRAQSFAGITGARLVTGDNAALLADPRLTAVYICAETDQHPALVRTAAARGLAVFCEKPLARTLPEAAAMAANVRGLTNQVGLILRYSPTYTVIKQLMAGAGLGPLLTAFMRDDQFFPIRGHYASDWRGSFARAGGGTLIEHSIHDIDLFRWLFGEIDAVRCHTRVTSGHEGVEDVALVTFQHEGGHQTTLTSAWHAMDERPSTRRLEVFFEGGWFTTDHDFLGPVRYQLRTGPEVELNTEEVFARYAAILGLDDREAPLARTGAIEDLRFLQAVAAGKQSFPDFATALEAHRVVDACYTSAREHREIVVRS
ncbi:MAG: Gfo/Idh/MocA family oxidoreductase [Chloroflexi bacterium]|nr:Gfo/Idh/MocA family oxidoreductase [Chloroflexota bacterium]